LQNDGVGQRAEHLVRGDAGLDQVDDVGLAKTPHLAATWCSFVSSKWSEVTISAGALTFNEALIDGGAGPEAHLSFIDAVAVLAPVSRPS